MMQHVGSDNITDEENDAQLQQTDQSKSSTVTTLPHEIEDDIHSESSQKSTDLANVTHSLCRTETSDMVSSVDNCLQKSDHETTDTSSGFSCLHSKTKLDKNDSPTETFSLSQYTPLSQDDLLNQDISLTENFSDSKDINIQVRYLLGKLYHEEEKLNHVLRLNEELQKHCKKLQINIDEQNRKLDILNKKNAEGTCKIEKNVDQCKLELQSRSQELAETKVLLAALCEDKEKVERLNEDHLNFLRYYHPPLIEQFNSWRQQQQINDSEQLASQRASTKVVGKKKKNLFKMLQNKAMNNYMFFSAV